MKSVWMRHHDHDANRVALARWLGSLSKVVGLVINEEVHPDLMSARCRCMLKPEIFAIPRPAAGRGGVNVGAGAL